MLIDLNYLKTNYDLKIKGVIHIGANNGQEISDYVSDNIKHLLFVEPIPNVYKNLLENIKPYSDKINVLSYNIALGNDTKDVDFIISSNNGMSSSILKPNLHLSLHPEVAFTDTISVPMNKLDNLDFDRNDYNFINIDVQGFELEVFKGASETLNGIDYIYTEVNNDYVYSDNALVEELDEYLLNFRFSRVETKWFADIFPWGDAFYIKVND